MRSTRPSDRRGTVVILTALLLTALFGMVAFAIDTGCIVHARTRLQRAADACALAGAELLPDENAAMLAAKETAVANHEDVKPGLALGDDAEGGRPDPIEVTPGYWNRNQATFTSPAPFGRQPNAVRVTLYRAEATGNPVRLFFARLLGTGQVDVKASAIAMYDTWLCGPFIGIEELSVPGSPGTDSYDSSEAPYSPLTARDRGSICSDGPITVEGAAVVMGDARAGKGYDVEIMGGAEVTGSIGTRMKPLNFEDVDATEVAALNDNDQIPLILQGNDLVSPVDANGDFLLDGTKTITLYEGTYYFRNFTVTGQAVFNVAEGAAVTIYVTGNMERSGGTVVNNLTQDPSKLVFLMTGGTAAVTSNNEFYGVIYAPHTDVTVDGDSDYYGAIIGRTLTITGTGMGHYDESLDLTDIEFPRRVALVD